MINILAGILLTLQVTTNEVEQLLIERATVHRAIPAEVVRVAKCENTHLTPGLVNYGGSGAIGIGQWMPGRGNHWDFSPAWRNYRIDIHEEYGRRNSDALYFDVDMFSWSFGEEASRMYPNIKNGWSCYRR